MENTEIMATSSSRKTVFLILTILMAVILFASRGGLIHRIKMWRETVPRNDFFTNKTMNAAYNKHSNPHHALNVLIEQYQQQIEAIRRQLLERNITITAKPAQWELLDGYDTQLFSKVIKYENINPVLMTSSFDLTKEMLPVKKYYNYVATNKTCHKMDKNSYHGPTLLNKTCLNSFKQVHNPVILDRTQLSVGLPFKMAQDRELPVGPNKDDVLLHFGFVVKDALILSHGIVFSNGSALQPQRCKPTLKTKVPSQQNSLPVYSEVFTTTEQTGTGFYHLTSEDLPRIAPYLAFLLKHKHIKIHCKSKPFFNNMLEHLGITRDRLISGDVRAKIAYMPAGTACGRPGVFTTQLLSTLFHRKLPEEILSLKQDTIVLIKRSSKGRRFLYHEKILYMLQEVANRRGLKVAEYLDHPTPSLNRTLEIFYRALMVIAPHGAGLSNLVFSRPGVVVLESYCIVNLCFRNLMVNIGHIHHGYMNEDFSCLHAKPENFKGDVEKHLDLLGLKKKINDIFTVTLKF